MKHRSDPECILQRSHFILAFFRATRNWFHKGAGGVGHSRPLVTERVSIRTIKSEANPTNGNPFLKKIIIPPADSETILPLSNIAPGIREPVIVPFEFHYGPDMCAFEVGERMREAQQKIRDAFWIEIKDLIEERKPFIVPNKKNFH